MRPPATCPRFWCTLALIISLLQPTAPSITHAAGLTVTTTTDELNRDGDCALREAIEALNRRAAVDACPAGTGDDVLTIPAGVYTLTLTAVRYENQNASGDLDLFPVFDGPGSRVTIVGAGMGVTILDGNATDRILSVINQRSAVRITGLTMRNGRVINYSGGAIMAISSLALERVALLANHSDGGGVGAVGGAVGDENFATPGATLSIVATLIAGNSAYRGGALSTMRPTTIADTTITANTAATAPAIAATAPLTITNTTIDHNRAIGTLQPEAIAGGNTPLTLRNSTISGNTGGMSYFNPQSTIANTILANDGANCVTPIVSSGGNLSSDASCDRFFTGPGDQTSRDPRLGPLQDNGGPTQTRALLMGSPAIDAGTAPCPPTDQRGSARPQGVRCDSGAVEMGDGVGALLRLYVPWVGSG